MSNSPNPPHDEVFIRDRISTNTDNTPSSIKVENIRNLLVKLKDQLRPKLDNLIFAGQQQALVENTSSQSWSKDLDRISQTLASLVFRIAVIGEFSKGKSTLLNAIIGEEIQPARAIPCSANINILRYGEQQKVIIKNKNGTQEEIPLEQYRSKVAMPVEMAITNHTDALIDSDIEEVIYEHPGLELFKNGIELIDSPGLNQHPDVERITQRIIKDVDAVIFVTSCLQPLTQNERQLLMKLKSQLNELAGKKIEEPAQNIFIIVNFVDLIRTSEDRQHIALLFEGLTKGQSPIISGNNRIHFISAQKTVDAIINHTEDEYLTSFRSFIQEINNFLNQRGFLRIQQPCNRFKQIIKDYLKELEKTETSILNNIQEIESEIGRITYQIGNAQNCQKEIQAEAERLTTLVSTEITKEWQEWSSDDSLTTRVQKESVSWVSKYNAVFQQKEIIKDYVNQLNIDLKNILEKWGSEQIVDIIQPQSESFDKFINDKLESIRLRVYGGTSKNKEIFNYQRYETKAKLEENFFGIIGLRGGVVLGSISALVVGLGFDPSMVQVLATGTAATILSSLGLGTIDVDKLKPRIRDRVIAEGIERFERPKFAKDMQKLINTIFDEKAKNVNKEIDKLIIEWKAELQKNEKAYQKSKEDQKPAQIKQQKQELQAILQEIEKLLVEATP